MVLLILLALLCDDSTPPPRFVVLRWRGREDLERLLTLGSTGTGVAPTSVSRPRVLIRLLERECSLALLARRLMAEARRWDGRWEVLDRRSDELLAFVAVSRVQVMTDVSSSSSSSATVVRFCATWLLTLMALALALALTFLCMDRRGVVGVCRLLESKRRDRPLQRLREERRLPGVVGPSDAEGSVLLLLSFTGTVRRYALRLDRLAPEPTRRRDPRFEGEDDEITCWLTEMDRARISSRAPPKKASERLFRSLRTLPG